MSLSVIALVVATILFFVFLRSRGKKVPRGLKELPGPKGLPWLGNVHQLGQFPNKQYCKWSKEFGKIFKVQLLNKTVVIISDPKYAKEIFSQNVFNGKPFIPGLYEHINENDLGMFRTDGSFWEAHRRFLLRQLRDFGFGKSGMQSLIMNEVSKVISSVRSKKGQPHHLADIRAGLRIASVNSLFTILLSKRFNHDDPEVRDISYKVTEAFEEVFKKGAILIFAPWLGKIAPELTGAKLAQDMTNENRERFTRYVMEHKATFDEDYMRDFTDTYFAEMKKAENDPSSPFYGDKAERHLIHMLFDLFLAGTDTTSTALSWIFLYLAKFPEVQKKLQQEITEITGNTRPTAVEDRLSMPYTLALIDEVLRHSGIVPDGNTHRALEDTEYQGYYIPKDAWIQPNIYYIHHNPETWGDPQNFRPERFLSSDGSKFVRNENVQAFQVGKRQCPGETLARDSIFLYMTNFAQQFWIEFAPGSKDPGFETNFGFFRSPLPYSILMKERNSN